MYNLYTESWETVVTKTTYENAVAIAKMKWRNCVVNEKGKVFSYTGVRIGTILGFTEGDN